MLATVGEIIYICVGNSHYPKPKNKFKLPKFKESFSIRL